MTAPAGSLRRSLALSIPLSLSVALAAPVALALAPACWTGAAPAAAPTPVSSSLAGPAGGTCPTRLVVVLHDVDTQQPLASATVVVETPLGSVATELTDAAGRFETAAVRPPAQLAIYHGAHTFVHALVTCQPPLRIAVRLSP